MSHFFRTPGASGGPATGSVGGMGAMNPLGSLRALGSQPPQRPIDRLLGAIDLAQLPGADELDEMILRVEALEHHIQSSHATMSTRIAALSAALARSEAKNLELAQQASLSSLTPAIAHDLATAVGNVSLVSDSMGDQFTQFEGKLNEGTLRRSEMDSFLRSVGEGIRILASASARAAELTLSLKNVAIDSASQRQRHFSLANLVDDVLVMLRPTLRPLPIAVTTDIPADIHLDHLPGPLEQVLINLIQNALVHAFDGSRPGALHISAATRDNQRISVSVIDNGVGMTPDVLAKVFTPYFTTRPNAGGSGVGLSYSKELVESKLAGSLSVSSIPGTGTHFCLEIPRQHP